MFSFHMFLSMLAVTLLAVTTESSTGGGGTFTYDLSGSDLTRLYNSPVYRAELMRRPLGSFTFMIGDISHSGVRVTLRDGSQWLIHKGGDFGIDSQTVVTKAGYMGPGWELIKSKDFRGRKTVADLVSAGGSNYRLFRDNCHKAAERMMNL